MEIYTFRINSNTVETWCHICEKNRFKNLILVIVSTNTCLKILSCHITVKNIFNISSIFHPYSKYSSALLDVLLDGFMS